MADETQHPEDYDRSLGDLLKELGGEASLLIRQEIALARAEMTQKLTMTATAGVMFGVAAFAGLMAMGALTACVILAIHLALAAWLSALIVTGGYVVIGGVCLAAGAARMRSARKPVLEQTIETLKEDVSWARHQARSAAT